MSPDKEHECNGAHARWANSSFANLEKKRAGLV